MYTVPARGAFGGPEHGTVTVDQATGTFVYNPDDDFAATGGTDTFTVIVSDAAGRPHLHGLLGKLTFGLAGHTTKAKVTINLTAVDDAPVANDDAITTPEDTPTSGNVLANDSDPDGKPLTVTLGDSPTKGTLELSDNGDFTYTPDPEFSGTDSFTYTVSDGQFTDTATVTITVAPINDPITAVDHMVTIDEDSGVASGNLLTHVRDQNPDGPDEVLTIIAIKGWNHGSFTISADGNYVYTPVPDFHGTDELLYTVSDGATTAVGTVKIVVKPVDDPITAVHETVTFAEDQGVLNGNVLNGVRNQNPDGPAEALEVEPIEIDDLDFGTITIDSNGNYTYTPRADFNGSFTVTYTVSDGKSVDGGALTIVVTPVNDAPAEPIVSPSELVPDIRTGVVTGTASSTDVDGDELTFSGSGTTALGGKVVVNADGTFSYTPSQIARENAQFAPTDTFTLTVSDGTTSTSTTVTVDIAPVNVLLGDVTLGRQPNGIAITPDGTRAYVANQSGDTVSVVDIIDYELIGTIRVGGSPVVIAMHPDGTYTYVTNQASGSVSVIDTSTDTVIDTIAVGGAPHGIKLSADGSRAYVTNLDSHRVSVIDTTTNTVIDAIPVNGEARSLAVSPDGSRIYVTLQNTDRVVEIDLDTGQIANLYLVGAYANRIVVTPDGTRAYVTNELGDSVSVLDLVDKTVMTTLQVDSNPNVLVISPDGTRVYVTSKDTTRVTIIDTATDSVIGAIDVGGANRGLAFDPTGTILHVSAGPVRTPTGPGWMAAYAVGALGGPDVGTRM